MNPFGLLVASLRASNSIKVSKLQISLNLMPQKKLVMRLIGSICYNKSQHLDLKSNKIGQDCKTFRENIFNSHYLSRTLRGRKRERERSESCCSRTAGPAGAVCAEGKTLIANCSSALL